MEKVLFVYNPRAGKSAMKNKLSDVVELFMQAQFDVTIHATQARGEAAAIVREKGRGCDRVICSGGDGTLHEVTHGLMSIEPDLRPKCGYIPAGTVNDFAAGIGLPKRILKSAAVAAGDRCHAYDIGDMNGEYFTYIAAFGAFTSVSYETPQSTKNVLGRTAYILDGMTELNKIKSQSVRIDVDGDISEFDCVLGMVANSRSVGGFKVFRKYKVELDDGYFDGIFVRMPRNPLELSMVTKFLLTGEENSLVKVVRGQKFCISSPADISYTLDGEDGGEYKKVLIENHKQAITFYHGKKV